MNKKLHLRAIAFGLTLCPVGVFAGIFIRHFAIGDYSEFPYCSSVSAFVASYLAWLFFVEWPKKCSAGRGACAGVFSALLAHYLCWYFMIVVANIQYWFFDMQIGSLPGEPIGPFFGLIAVLLYTVVSYIFCGWFTLPAGAFIGSIFGFIMAKSYKP